MFLLVGGAVNLIFLLSCFWGASLFAVFAREGDMLLDMLGELLSLPQPSNRSLSFAVFGRWAVSTYVYVDRRYVCIMYVCR